MNYPNIQVTQGLAGWFAVKMWWNPDPGFPEPWDSGQGRYSLQSEAIAEGQEWAENEGIPFIMPAIDEAPARQDVVNQIKELLPGVQVIHLEGR